MADLAARRAKAALEAWFSETITHPSPEEVEDMTEALKADTVTEALLAWFGDANQSGYNPGQWGDHDVEAMSRAREAAEKVTR